MHADYQALGAVGIAIQRRLDELERRMLRAEGALRCVTSVGKCSIEDRLALVEIGKEENDDGL